MSNTEDMVDILATLLRRVEEQMNTLLKQPLKSNSCTDSASNSVDSCDYSATHSDGAKLERNESHAVYRLAYMLIDALRLTNFAIKVPDLFVVHNLLRWFQLSMSAPMSPSPSMSTVSCPEYGDIQDKLHRLESDRESLSLQVSVLNEQVGAQTEKIKDLESMLDDKLHTLDSTEEILHEQLLTRTTLETNKLDLLAEISNLKLQLACIQREKLESEQRIMHAQTEIAKLQKLVLDRQFETFHRYDAANSVVGPTRCATSGFNQINEVDELRSAVHQLVLDNEEKDHKIAQLKAIVEGQPTHMNTSMSLDSSGFSSYKSNVLKPFQQQQDHFDLNAQLQRLLTEDFDTATTVPHMSSSVSYPVSFLDTRAPSHSATYQTALSCPPTSSSPYGSSSTPYRNASPNYLLGSGLGDAQTVISSKSPSDTPTPRTDRSAAPSRCGRPGDIQSVAGASSSTDAAKQLAAELNLLAPKRSATTASGPATGSLPRYSSLSQKPPIIPKKSAASMSASSSAEGRPSRSTQGKGFKWLKEHFRPNKRSTSAPNLDRKNVLNELECISNSDDETIDSAGQFNEKLKQNKKHCSVKNFLFRRRRSTSQEDKQENCGLTLKRDSNTRHTMGPKCRAWSRDPVSRRQQVPIRPSFEQFCQWGAETLCDWLAESGLNIYAPECSKNIKSGRHLISLSPADIEKELAMKNHLHQKKLMLALRGIEFGKLEPADNMDYHQVLRWLDDIGLPQFRDAFAENRIDGAVLNVMTVEDLLTLKVTSALHHATLRRGLEFLREIDFSLNRLQRKFNPDVIGKGPIPNAVQFWTQHYVSEWLRTIDLTEFTPNLMCAGVHGALMVLEPTFTADSLAAVLNIPQQKSLLRRHLAMHFSDLLGTEVISHKRDVLCRPGAVELMPGVKVKASKKWATSSRKKSRSEVYLDPDNLICPLVPARRSSTSSVAVLSRNNKIPESISEQLIARLESSNV